MSTELSLSEIQKAWHGTLKSYTLGFIVSIFLTFLSFSLVLTKAFAAHTLIYVVIGLAILQAIVQLIFFLHLGQEPKPRWETISFAFMIMVLMIVVIGSLWVMNDLNERMMPDMHMNGHHMHHMHKDMSHD